MSTKSAAGVVVGIGLLDLFGVLLVTGLAASVIGIAAAAVGAVAALAIGVIYYVRYARTALAERDIHWLVDLGLAPVIGATMAFVLYDVYFDAWSGWVNLLQATGRTGLGGALQGLLLGAFGCLILVAAPWASVMYMGARQWSTRLVAYVAFAIGCSYWLVLVQAYTKGLLFV